MTIITTTGKYGRVTNKMLCREGLPLATSKMLAVLKRLIGAKRNDMGFIPLDGVHGRTIWSLVERDWIIEQDGPDGVSRYRITGRGEKAYRVYSKPSRYHFDGLCPDCRERPRVGNLGYCRECHRARQLRTYREKGHQSKPGAICPRCQERPRHTYPSGHMIAYCLPCRDVMRAEERQRKHARRLGLIQAGNPPKCLKCDRPIYHTPGGTTYDYCYEHYREQQRRAAHRRAFKRLFNQSSIRKVTP